MPLVSVSRLQIDPAVDSAADSTYLTWSPVPAAFRRFGGYTSLKELLFALANHRRIIRVVSECTSVSSIEIAAPIKVVGQNGLVGS
jgi:hypothetical protein